MPKVDFDAQERGQIEELVERLAPRNHPETAEAVKVLREDIAVEIEDSARTVIRRAAEATLAARWSLEHILGPDANVPDDGPQGEAPWRTALRWIDSALIEVDPYSVDSKRMDTLAANVWGDGDGTPRDALGSLVPDVVQSILGTAPEPERRVVRVLSYGRTDSLVVAVDGDVVALDDIAREIMAPDYDADLPRLWDVFGMDSGEVSNRVSLEDGRILELRPLADMEHALTYKHFERSFTPEDHRWLLDRERHIIEQIVRLGLLVPFFVETARSFGTPLARAPLGASTAPMALLRVIAEHVPDSDQEPAELERLRLLHDRLTWFESEALSDKSHEAFERATELAVEAALRLTNGGTDA